MKKKRPIANTLFQFIKITLMQLVLAFFFSSLAFANHTYAQPELNQKVTLKIENKQLKKVLSQIEILTNVSFTYVPQVIQADRKVTLSVTDESLGDVLQKLLSPLKISFEMVGKKIVLSRIPGLTDANPNTLNATQTQVALTVSGKVTDKVDGSGLPGVNIGVKGTAIGTTTGADGSYTLNNVPDNATLVFSFVGYVSQEIAVGNQSTINIILSSDIKTLDEVVVIGYGTQQKKDVTGGVVAINSKDFNQGIISSPEQLLQGRAAGVQMTPASGEPGAGVNLRIRGTTSVRSGNGPLYVIDGVPVSGDNTSDAGVDYGSGTGAAKNPLNFLNPQDIENITVLKDASAAAIYGSRAANGVVIITTKKGKSGQSSLNFSASTSFGSTLKRYDLVKASDYPAALTNSGNHVNSVTVGKGNTDWQNEIYRTAVSQNYNINYGGGNDNTRYFMSLGYSDQQGVVKNTGLQRVTGRINASHELLNDKLKLELQLTTSGVHDKYAPIGNNAGFEGSLIGAALQTNPTYPVYDSLGRYFTSGGYDLATNHPKSGFRNPVAMLNGIHDNSSTYRTLANISASYHILKNLTYKLNFGIDNSTSERAQKIDPFLPGYPSAKVNNISVFTGFNNVSNRTTFNKLIEHTLNYNVKAGIGQLDVLGGFSYQKFANKGHYVQSGNFVDTTGAVDNIGYVDNNTYKAFFAGEDKSQSELQSFFGRVNYNISDKYLLTATYRRDGSSKFGADNKYGNFYAFAAAWRLSNENFIPKDIFSDLKLRANYGITGNQEFPANLTQPTRIPQPNNPNGAANADNAENKKLKWEQTTQYGIGLDFSILGGRLSGTIDYFNKGTKDLLFKTKNPISQAPQPNIWVNLDALVVNKGMELSLNYSALKGKKLTWDISYNMTYLKNNVERFKGAGPFVKTGLIDGQGLSNAYSQHIQEGYPLFAFFVPQYGGFDANGKAVPFSDNGVYSGNPQPKLSLGLTNNFNYQNWSLSIFVTSSQGFYVYNNTANALFYKAALNQAHNVTKEVANSNEYHFNAGGVSTRFLEKGNFIRLSNVNLGYTFKIPTSISNQIKTLRLSLTGQNLLLITKYKGTDPEVNTDKNIGGVPSLGIDYTSYPTARVFTLGLTAGF